MSEYPQALKVQEEKLIDSDEPASKKPRLPAILSFFLRSCGKWQIQLEKYVFRCKMQNYI